MHQHQQDPIALVVCLGKMEGVDDAVSKILSLPRTQKCLFAKQNLAPNTSGLAVEVGFGHSAGKQNISINARTKMQPDDRTQLTCCQNSQLSQVLEPLLLQVMQPIKKTLDAHKPAFLFFKKIVETKFQGLFMML